MSNFKRNFTNDKYSTTPTFKTIVDSEKKAKKKDPIRVLYKQTGKNPRVRIIPNVQMLKRAIINREFNIIPYQNVFLICNNQDYMKTTPINVVFDFFHISGDLLVVQIDRKKNLHIGINQAYDLFKQDDFPTITIGKRKTVTIASYLLWKISKNGGDV